VKWQWRRRYPSLLHPAVEEEDEASGSSDQEQDENTEKWQCKRKAGARCGNAIFPKEANC
jgi:hypothetical protein